MGEHSIETGPSYMEISLIQVEQQPASAASPLQLQELPIQEEPIQEEPIQEEPIQEDPIQKELEPPAKKHKTTSTIAEYLEKTDYDATIEELCCEMSLVKAKT